MLDSTAWANGVHTIAWTVADNQGAIAGVGSRFFTVSNSSSGLTASAAATSFSSATRSAPGAHRSLQSVPPSSMHIGVRRGFDENAPTELVWPDVDGINCVRTSPLDRSS
jgi:hypothetical protein